MQLNLLGAKAGDISAQLDVSDSAFGQKFNEALVHQVVTSYLAGGRAGTRAQKNRSDVSGGGKKPWRQKGTGRARAGTTRGPLWRKGGVTFAARPQDHSQKVNRKMYKGAIRAIFSELIRQGNLYAVESFTIDAPKSKELFNALKLMGLSNVLIVLDNLDEKICLAARNLPHVAVCDVKNADPVSLIKFENVLITVPAIKMMEEQLG